MKRFLILALTVILLVSMTVMPAAATDGGSAAVSPAYGKAGGVAELTVSLAGFDEGNTIGVTIIPSDGLVLEAGMSKWLLDGEVSDISDGQAAWAVTDAMNVNTEVLRLAVRIPESAAQGTVYTVEVKVLVKNNEEELGTATATGTVSLYTKAESLELSETELKLDLKEVPEATLTVTVQPESANEPVVWSSSDPQVAQVRDGVVTGQKPGTANITATAGDVSATCAVTVECSHAYSDDRDTECDLCGHTRQVEEKVETTAMYRLYNPNSGEHFYTGSVEERDMLDSVGWNYEGVAWNAPTQTGEPVYRLFNPNSGDHHYTMSAEEREMLVGVGWRYEGVCWNSASNDNVPQYRLYNPNADCGSHHYTGSTEERDYLVSLGWIYEGIGWFGIP